MNTSSTQRTYRVRCEHPRLSDGQTFDVAASDEALLQLEREGFVVRERLIPPDLLQLLRDAADEVEARELQLRKPYEGGGFGGLFVRNLIDHHPTFLDLMCWNPLTSVARAMLGPQVQLHASVLRVAYSDMKGQAVEWHWHQRVVPEPAPPFFARPVVLDNLIYLDDLTPETGPLVVLPSSHLHNADYIKGDFSDKDGQVTVTCPAGSVVTSHSSLWHKALSPKPGAPKRRLLIFGFSPVWMKQVDRPQGTLVQDNETDEELKELLGRTGYF